MYEEVCEEANIDPADIIGFTDLKEVEDVAFYQFLNVLAGLQQRDKLQEYIQEWWSAHPTTSTAKNNACLEGYTKKKSTTEEAEERKEQERKEEDDV